MLKLLEVVLLSVFVLIVRPTRRIKRSGDMRGGWGSGGADEWPRSSTVGCSQSALQRSDCSGDAWMEGTSRKMKKKGRVAENCRLRASLTLLLARQVK